ncbi:hypothetical protein [Mesohalobacter halotolerans]|uniref:Uncharacterized protein n=1 Tax=Mesohalobacter halotolerans TaxID=1883405 RepID=A0A4U5TW47_9FLAO|nr:hypothetical protein [Mesohalobacter halotolerans]MBS3739511.1 hypothetical protein [Psychroflexus sp.]TKS57458.1 hypothetical protein FCN74_03305 [Mesohalobacter halotolerans]
MKNIVLKLSLIIALLIYATSEIYAQLPPGFGDTNVDDTTPAPISGLVALGVIVGGALGYKKLKK